MIISTYFFLPLVSFDDILERPVMNWYWHQSFISISTLLSTFPGHTLSTRLFNLPVIHGINKVRALELYRTYRPQKDFSSSRAVRRAIRRPSELLTYFTSFSGAIKRIPWYGDFLVIVTANYMYVIHLMNFVLRPNEEVKSSVWVTVFPTIHLIVHPSGIVLLLPW